MSVSAQQILTLLQNSSMEAFAIFLANQLNSVDAENAGGVVQLGNGVVIIQGDGAPVDGTTGLDVAGLGSLYLDVTNGALYINQDDNTNPTWALESSVTPINSLLTGFVSGAGTVASTDSILEGIQKLSGNLQNKAVTANVLTGLAAGSATPIAETDTILVALANLQAQIDAL